MRQLLLLVLFVLAGRWLVKTLRAADAQAAGTRAGAPGVSGARTAPPQGSAKTPTASLAEPIVRCAACGVHAPKSDSIVLDAQYYCCAEHARSRAASTGGRAAR
ncbi:PP0621 family protein [Trinickia fusca]|uniref:Deaminase n=1 Tax=Trinickia fusca TaxID=2419777 RepID=A0A494XSV1_9BURK|nr:PP0621 family protein [Trinickia fusca]RKP51169.1 deaminase [Trinickia fusca]